ncbi:MAG: hypothetical protein Q7T05_05020 [Dehalococcoidia bacterium]|nr:hypothetical protein [Dehalococcoidia bacterium]
MASDLNEIFKRLNVYFARYRVVSEDEIASAVSDVVDKLDPETRKKLEGELRGDLKKVLTESIVSDPISVYSPNLTSKRNYLGETFYHYPTHDFLADELEEGFKRLMKIRNVTKLVVMEEVVVALLKKSGYDVEPETSGNNASGRLTASKADKKLTVLILPSVNFAAEHAGSMDDAQDYVIVVPTDKTPAPFIQFCREKAEDFAGKKLQMWVVDTDKKTVNPFLGYTHDDDIHRNFENPKLAAFACRMYGVGRELWVRSA